LAIVFFKVNSQIVAAIEVAISTKLKETALKNDSVQAHINGRKIERVVVLPGRSVNVITELVK